MSSSLRLWLKHTQPLQYKPPCRFESAYPLTGFCRVRPTGSTTKVQRYQIRVQALVLADRKCGFALDQVYFVKSVQTADHSRVCKKDAHILTTHLKITQANHGRMTVTEKLNLTQILTLSFQLISKMPVSQKNGRRHVKLTIGSTRNVSATQSG